MDIEASPENSKETVDIHYLRSFQSLLFQHRSLLNECKQEMCLVVGSNKDALIREIEELNRRCYKHQLTLLASYRSYVPLLNPSILPRRILFCTNERDYLGTFYSWLMRVLIGLRQSPQLFECFVESIDNISGTLPSLTLNGLAEDLVFMFFADFSSTDKNVSNLLRQFQVILVKVVKAHAAGDCPMLFEDQELMVNRLIKAFLNNNHNRDYLSLLFGKLFDEATDLRNYARRIREKKVLGSRTAPLASERTQAQSSRTGDSPVSQKFTTGSMEELKGGSADKSKMNDILLICDGIINRIVKKLLHMPLAIRYFCKLVENVVLQHVVLR
eukprot:TRINITY_DN2030_c0_g2_i1.p1 TRINITY_DN2030_c0_g2~~TRINITY_DN2030_c0_g2_i1.p1  ORF type:complete len:375 (-),score=95.21 TRINITY_DN2030_c0_g2_i1:909-1895(-)